MSKITIKTDTETFQGFLWFIEERYNIYRKKEVLQLPAPWTTDEILINGKFGNIYREWDRGTRWEIKQLVKHYNTSLFNDDIIFKDMELILTYRHNLIPQTTKILMTETTQQARSYFANMETPIISNVIDIYPFLNPHDTWVDYVTAHYEDVKVKLNDVVKYIQAEININPYIFHLYLQHMFPRLGEFKAYEVMTSITYTQWYPWSVDDFLYIGDGAKSMISRLIGYPDIDAKYLPLYLPGLKNIVIYELYKRGNIPFHDCPSFTVRTLEDCACEYRKYVAVRDGVRKNKPYPDNLHRWDEIDV